MAGMDFEGGDLGFSYGDFVEDPKNIPSSEQLKVPVPSKQKSKSRLLLERYMRDFDKATEKKILDVKSILSTFEDRGPPRVSDPNELTRIVDSLVKKQKARIEKIAIQVEKEFDNIETRLKTQKGRTEDFEAIQSAKSTLDQVVSSLPSLFDQAGKTLEQRGLDKLTKREQKRQRRDVLKLAQEAGEEAKKSFLEENRDQIKESTTELVLGSLDKILLLGRRGRIFGSDEKEKRLNDLIAKANQQGASVFGKVFKDAGGEDQDPPNVTTEKFDPSTVVPGFRKKDISSGRSAFLSKVAGIASTVAIFDMLMNRVQKGAGELSRGVGTGQMRTSDLASKFLGENIPLNAPGKVFSEILRSVEVIADVVTSQVTPFSPALLEASIDRQIMFLEDNMRRGDELGNILTDIYKSRTSLELEMRKAGDKILNELGPHLVSAANLLAALIEWFNVNGPQITTIITILSPISGLLLKILKTIQPIPQAGNNISSTYMQQIDAFFRNQSFPGSQPNTNIPKALTI